MPTEIVQKQIFLVLREKYRKGDTILMEVQSKWGTEDEALNRAKQGAVFTEEQFFVVEATQISPDWNS